jgi:serine/threonine protein kinase
MANRNGVSAWCVGAQIDGRFELLEWRSNAGGAVVWRGKQSNAIHEAYVTIVQHPHTLRPGVLEERRREAQAASVVSSDAWVRVIGFGEWAGLSYLVADDIRGHSIEDMMRFVKEASTGALFPGVLVHIALQVLTAVERANEAGVVHGDICTGSVFYADGVAKLLFLGLARAHDHPGQPHLHMTPEQVNGAPPDPGADLWAVGVLMHCMACGSYRLKESAAGFVHDLSLEEIHAPPKLRAIIMRSLERNVQLRYRTPSEMRQDLVAAAAAMPHTGRAHSPYGITMPPSQQGTLSATLWSGAPALTPRRDGSNPATPRAAAPSVPERLTEYIAAGYRSTSSSPTKAVHEWQRVQSQSSRDAHTSCDPIKHEVTKCDAPAKLPRSVQRSGGITRDTPIPPPRAHPPSVVSHNPMHPLEVEMVIRDEAETRASGEGVDGGFLQSTLRRAAGGGGGASPRNVMPGSVGLIVTSQVPHRVLQVADMCDLNGVMQGRAGYANASVLPGDRLLAVDGVPVEWLPISKVCVEYASLCLCALRAGGMC